MNEFDYSGLYNNTANNSAETQNVTQPQQNADATAQQTYTQASQQTYTQATQQPYQQASQQTYTNPQFTQPQPQRKPSNSSGKALRIVASIALVAVCLGAGVGGGYIGSRLNSANVISAAEDAAKSAAQSSSTTVAIPTVAADSELTVPEISAIVKPSVVEVMTESVTTNPYFGSYVTAGAGSGVIISEDGYIITNAHVVSDANTITVTTSDSTTHDAQVVGYDTNNDIAVLKIDATGLTAAKIGDSSKLVVGEFALAVGNPLGRLGGTVTEGIISALDREVTLNGSTMTLLQTSAGISPGNSGGGLFNGRGELVGVVNAKPSSTEAEGLGFAIPINIANEIAQNIIDNKGTSNAILGVTVLTIPDATTAAQYGLSSPGLYVQSVNTGSGAENAGIQQGDMFVAIDNVAIASSDELKSELAKHEPGDVVEIQLVREKQLMKVSVTLTEHIETVQIS